MARQVMNPDFFKKKTVAAPAAAVNVPSEKKTQEPAPKPVPASQPEKKPIPPQPRQRQQVVTEGPGQKVQSQAKQAPPPEKAPEKVFIRMGHRTAIAMKEAAEALRQCGQTKLAQDVEQIPKDVARDKFTVAVVGEFSRGKSTFINRLLGKELLPTGDMPTTALPCRIRYNSKDAIAVFDEKGRRVRAVPLTQEAWEGLTTDPFGGEDPKGSLVVGTQVPWLLRSGIDLMDTPGAGDLEEDRIQVISDALLKADGAVIAISATLPLSMSEKFFIEQRLIARKTPFLMIIVTKMDQIPVTRRNDMLDYFHTKLKQWNMNIPVFVPYTLEMPDDRYRSSVGMDKVRHLLETWVRDPQRLHLTEMWAAARAEEKLDVGISALQERLCLLDADDDKRLALIEEKKRQLSKAGETWQSLRGQMSDRQKACFEKFRSRTDDYIGTITERLQYEAAHAANPQKWWKEDYPYRLKVELTNMSVHVNDILSRQMMEDAAWFNRSLDKCFKSNVLMERDTIVDRNRFAQIQPEQNVELESLDQKRSVTRVAISAASIAGAIALNLAGVGFLSVVATMGVSTGASLFSEHFFKGKLEKQREELKAAIAKQVPQLIGQAADECEDKIDEVYQGILREAVEKENAWMEAQTAAIESSLESQGSEQRQRVLEQLQRLENAKTRLSAMGNA